MAGASRNNVNSIKYLDVLRDYMGGADPRLVALWFYAKSVADEHGVPDVVEGAFPDAYRDAIDSLRELRHNLRSCLPRDREEGG